jgi:hypothetical protein
VQTDVLDTDKVFAGGQRLLDCPFKAIFLPRAPGAVVAGGARADACFVDFDLRKMSVGYEIRMARRITYPVARAIIIRHFSRRFADVHKPWTRVFDKLVVEQLEPDLVAGLHSVCGSATGLGALVAAQVVRIHELRGEGWVVAIAVLARVCIFTTDGGPVDDEPIEDVVGLGEWRKEEEEVEGLHVEGWTMLQMCECCELEAEESRTAMRSGFYVKKSATFSCGEFRYWRKDPVPAIYPSFTNREFSSVQLLSST